MSTHYTIRLTANQHAFLVEHLRRIALESYIYDPAREQAKELWLQLQDAQEEALHD